MKSKEGGGQKTKKKENDGWKRILQDRQMQGACVNTGDAELCARKSPGHADPFLKTFKDSFLIAESGKAD